MKLPHPPSRRAVTMMEMMIAAALTAVIMASTFTLVRTSHTAWRAHQDDLGPLSSAHAAVRHIVRHIRQAQAVSDFDSAGSLSLLMPSGETYVWQYDSANDQILFGSGAASDLLAEGITQMTLTAFQADGVTPATDVSEIHLIRCNLQVVLPRGAGATQTVTSWAWMRAW